MTALYVRRVHEREWTLYRDLRREATADTPAAFASSPVHEGERPESSWRAALTRGYTVVACLDADPVGFAGGRLSGSQPWMAGLEELWVAPGARGIAVPGPDGPSPADVLLLVLCGWARRNGCTRMRAVLPGGLAAAGAFAARHGFEPTGERRAIAGPVPRLGEVVTCDLDALGRSPTDHVVYESRGHGPEAGCGLRIVKACARSS